MKKRDGYNVVAKRADKPKTYNLSYGKASKKLEDVLSFNGAVWETETYPIPERYKLKRDALAEWGDIVKAAYENGGVAPPLPVEQDITKIFDNGIMGDDSTTKSMTPEWDGVDDDDPADDEPLTPTEALKDICKFFMNWRVIRESIPFMAAEKVLEREGVELCWWKNADKTSLGKKKSK